MLTVTPVDSGLDLEFEAETVRKKQFQSITAKIYADLPRHLHQANDATYTVSAKVASTSETAVSVETSIAGASRVSLTGKKSSLVTAVESRSNSKLLRTRS